LGAGEAFGLEREPMLIKVAFGFGLAFSDKDLFPPALWIVKIQSDRFLSRRKS
jgi:hypothetical protein